MRIKPRQQFEEFTVVSDDGGDWRGAHLLAIARRDARQEPLFGRAAVHQHEPHRLAIAARRTEAGQPERCLDQAFRDRPRLPMRKGARLVEHRWEQAAYRWCHARLLSPLCFPLLVTACRRNAIGDPNERKFIVEIYPLTFSLV